MPTNFFKYHFDGWIKKWLIAAVLSSSMTILLIGFSGPVIGKGWFVFLFLGPGISGAVSNALVFGKRRVRDALTMFFALPISLMTMDLVEKIIPTNWAIVTVSSFTLLMVYLIIKRSSVDIGVYVITIAYIPLMFLPSLQPLWGLQHAFLSSFVIWLFCHHLMIAIDDHSWRKKEMSKDKSI
jgi:hypothetical protein